MKAGMINKNTEHHVSITGGCGENALTVDGEGDSFLGAGVEMRILCQTGIVPCMPTQNLGDGELCSSVDLGVIVEPDVLAGRVG